MNDKNSFVTNDYFFFLFCNIKRILCIAAVSVTPLLFVLLVVVGGVENFDDKQLVDFCTLRFEIPFGLDEGVLVVFVVDFDDDDDDIVTVDFDNLPLAIFNIGPLFCSVYYRLSSGSNGPNNGSLLSNVSSLSSSSAIDGNSELPF
ncbi:hypothetical protein DERP_013013 [Dermatophagoides pteronyssinus]|uniref:Transmembrane protein n=1 Tax=Dermatophagoides pteronyssinus TaxID=6956 RepID=A0ABQ8JPZ7_DERPT|nr:hypothetical protein DERP_013013 [Dermatophagoides pteronyssinus]